MAVLLCCLCNTTVVISSGYRELMTNQGDHQPNLFSLGTGSPSCVPGVGVKGAQFTDTYGGLCGDQSYIHKLGHEYQLTDGIGGSLLSQ